MEHLKYQRLEKDCQREIANDNLEKCLNLLMENLNTAIEGISTELFSIKGQLNMIEKEKRKGKMHFIEYGIERNKIRDNLLSFLKIALDEENISWDSSVNDRILIIACKNSPTKWKKLFNEAFFSHVSFIVYKDDIPDDFKNPDVVIFDDLECGGKSGSFMGKYIEEMPKAHILYVGKENPLEEDNPAAYKRCANANSEITVLARLRELLEYRKVYGLPDE